LLLEIETTLDALFRADPEPLLNHREPASDDCMTSVTNYHGIFLHEATSSPRKSIIWEVGCDVARTRTAAS
jgi:hypothetical protein